jgi:hypothetical protein
MTPLPPESVFSTIQAGWPADGVLFAAVASINGLKNRETSLGGVIPPDPDFLRALAMLRKIQLSGAVGLRVVQDDQKRGTSLLTFRGKDISSETLDDTHELRRLLRLDPDAGEFKLAFGATAANNKEVAVLTRSILHLMQTMASQVEAPVEDLAQTRAVPGWESAADKPGATQKVSSKMNILLKASTLAAFLGLALAPMPRSLAAESADMAQAAKAKMEATRAEVAKIRNQVGLTLEELNRMRKDSVELRDQFQKYADELAKMEEQAQVARNRVISMEERGHAFFKTWEDQIKSIANAEIRDQAQKRYNKRVKSYNKIVKAMTEARDELKPFMSDLNDVKKLLDSELSRESVKSASNLIKQANWHGEDVVDSLKDVETELDRVSAELAKYQ